MKEITFEEFYNKVEGEKVGVKYDDDVWLEGTMQSVTTFGDWEEWNKGNKDSAPAIEFTIVSNDDEESLILTAGEIQGSTFYEY